MNNIKTNKVQRFSNYSLLFLLMANSGFPYFSGSEVLQVLLLIISFIIIRIRGKKVGKSFYQIILIFIIVELLQILLHNVFNLKTFIGTYVKLATVFFIVKLIGHNYDKYVINIIYFFTIISLAFYSLSFVPGFVDYFLTNITPYFESPFVEENSFYKRAPSIIVFCFESTLLSNFRNSGPFWEPGAFSVYLNIAILFNVIREGKLFNKKNIIFIIGVITTFSTAGYIALFIIITGYFSIDKKLWSKLVLIFILLISSYLFTQLDFLERKILNNINIAQETTSSRFGSALADYNLFTKSPLVGWGRGDARYGSEGVREFTITEHRNNGIFILLATYGIFITLVYFFLINKSFSAIIKFRKFKPWFSYVSLAVLLILGFSQGIFSLPFMYSFLFVFANYNFRFINVRISRNYSNLQQKRFFSQIVKTAS